MNRSSRSGGYFSVAAPAERLTLPALRIVGTRWLDGDRLYVPRWVSHLSPLMRDRSEDDWREYFAWAIGTGFTGVRLFAGHLGWRDRPEQSSVEARRRLPRYLELAAEHGLAVEVATLTDSGAGYDVEQHVREVAAIVAPHRQHVICEVANEIGHGTQRGDLTIERCLELGRRYFEPAGILWTTGAPLSSDEPVQERPGDEHSPVFWPAAGARYNASHLDRGRDFWNQCRRVREIYAISSITDQPCLDNEPMGADELDGGETGRQRINEPAFFFALGALDRAFPGVGGVHHSQAGLHAETPGPVQQACADAYVAGHCAVASALAGGEGDYRNAGHTGSPVERYTDEQWARDIVRHYSFTAGDRGVSITIGRRPGLELNWANGWRPVERIDARARADGTRCEVWSVTR